jgi:hypothetical protein
MNGIRKSDHPDARKMEACLREVGFDFYVIDYRTDWESVTVRHANGNCSPVLWRAFTLVQPDNVSCWPCWEDDELIETCDHDWRVEDKPVLAVGKEHGHGPG